MSLLVKNLQVTIGDKTILRNVSLKVEQGEIVALQGVNGSGKTTLARTLAGDPSLKILKGTALIDKVNLLNLPPDKRLAAGIFLTFQHPVELPNITVISFLKAIYFNQVGASLEKFAADLEEYIAILGLPADFLSRITNQDFSGGEKKKLELLQLLLLKPKYAILDELDSGVDREALNIFAKTIKKSASKDKVGFLVISHYQKFVDLLSPDKLVTLKDGSTNA